MFTRLGLPMNHYTISFFHAFARSADFEFQLILYLGIDTVRHLVQSDFFFFFFLQRSTQNFEIRRRVSRVKKTLTKFKKNTHTHTHLSLSLSLYLSMFTLTCLHQSLSLHLQTWLGSRSDPKGIQDRMFRQFKNVCMR